MTPRARLVTEPQEQRYRNYRIYYDPPPIPIRNCDWHFVHDDYDLDDPRHGHCASAAECRREIDWLCEEYPDEDGEEPGNPHDIPEREQ